MSINEFEIEFDVIPNEFEIDLEPFVKEVYPDLGELTVTPTNVEQTHEGSYGKVIVLGDENLTPENIMKNKIVFGVEGTATSDATATENDIAMGKIAYVDGEKITGVASISNFAITDASYLFYRGVRVDEVENIISLLSKPTSCEYMFCSCPNIAEIPYFDTSNCINFNSMCQECYKITNFPQLDTSNGKRFSMMFYYTSTVRGEIVIPLLDFSKATNIQQIFGQRKSVTLGGFKNLGKAYTQKSTNYVQHTLDLSKIKTVDYNSLMNVINNLYDLNLTYDVANGGTLYTQQLVLGSTNLAKLTDEEIAIATAKGWSVS